MPGELNQETLYKAALEGLEARRERIVAQMESIQSEMGGKRTATVPAKAATPRKMGGKRVLSEEARQRMADGQRRRWAKARGEA